MTQTDTLTVVVKADCPTCVMAAPALRTLADAGVEIVSQDDPAFPGGIDHVVDDTTLERSADLAIEVVPTLVRFTNGIESSRVEGWDRARWAEVSGIAGLGADLPERRPGCGSLTLDPRRADELLVRQRAGTLASRRVTLSALEDDVDAFDARGWGDGLPVVPPTEARVLRMLEGTDRAPDEVVAVVPPDLTPATVEKVAINAVLAGCRPEYLPVVLAAVEAACTDGFNMHGLLATTWFAGPMVVVSGPVARDIGMNDAMNALGQGNRANATIGRALQLIVRNVGGDKVDVTTLVGPDGDAHVYTPTPADAKRIADAKLVIVNGLDFEGWLSRLVKSSGKKPTIATATRGIAPRKLGSHADGPRAPGRLPRRGSAHTTPRQDHRLRRVRAGP